MFKLSCFSKFICISSFLCVKTALSNDPPSARHMLLNIASDQKVVFLWDRSFLTWAEKGRHGHYLQPAQHRTYMKKDLNQQIRAAGLLQYHSIR